jgi:putative FmdB family regulatory protein
MPTYLYKCSALDQEFEEYHSIKTKLTDCPLCKEKGLAAHAPDRLISGGSGKGIVELSGHELMAKAKEDARQFKKETYGSANKYANVLGETTYNNIQTKMDRNK